MEATFNRGFHQMKKSVPQEVPLQGMREKEMCTDFQNPAGYPSGASVGAAMRESDF